MSLLMWVGFVVGLALGWALSIRLVERWWAKRDAYWYVNR
jgi:hypothetical protein